MWRSMASLEKSSERSDITRQRKLSGTPAIFLRSWAPADGGQLWPLIHDYLKETYEAGYDVPPTGANVLLMLNMGIVAAQEGEPVVVAEAVGELLAKIVGWTFWKAAGGAVTSRKRSLVGLGTYDVPYMRRLGVAKAMHEEATKVARARGYECIDRIGILDTAGAKMLENGGWKFVAAVFRKELLCTGP